MAKLDIARALRDQEYFDSLAPADQAKVREAGGVGTSGVSDDDLESVSGGLEGGSSLLYTSSTGSGCLSEPAGETDPKEPVVSCNC